MRNVLLFGVALAAATPAVASDRTSYRAIAAGDYQTAEKTLLAERRIFPQRPELMINLATVYARTGRLTEAASLYRGALAEDPVDMALPNGAVETSHAVAQRGLDSLGPVTLAGR